VRDVAVTTHDRSTTRLLEDTTGCLVQLLDQYDLGWWSRYSLYPHPLPDAAKPFYHRLHVVQLQVLEKLTGVQQFGRVADTWAGYDTRLAATRAVASKIPFVALNTVVGRRRRTAGGSAPHRRSSS
jgi:heparosan-N-sulfate-glucuronate 5-epimerase